jgi:hypothetical protein
MPRLSPGARTELPHPNRGRPGRRRGLRTITLFLPEEVANVWRLWKQGIVRENYAAVTRTVEAARAGGFRIFYLTECLGAKQHACGGGV